MIVILPNQIFLKLIIEIFLSSLDLMWTVLRTVSLLLYWLVKCGSPFALTVCTFCHATSASGFCFCSALCSVFLPHSVYMFGVCMCVCACLCRNRSTGPGRSHSSSVVSCNEDFFRYFTPPQQPCQIVVSDQLFCAFSIIFEKLMTCCFLHYTYPVLLLLTLTLLWF